ncbi:MAG: hypothetical protein HYS07_04165 [Chlamydiae bacterium]|nr:hypothetical protein [Chlamydiota bacterium]MBI3277394.1 hypothetical protein [Chlamydiota bacterium]
MNKFMVKFFAIFSFFILTSFLHADDTAILHTSSGSTTYNGPYNWGCWSSGYPILQSDGSYQYVYDNTSSSCTDGYGGSAFVLNTPLTVSDSIHSIKIKVKKMSSYSAPSKIKIEFKNSDASVVTAIYVDQFGDGSSYYTYEATFTFSGDSISEVVVVADQKEKAGFQFLDAYLSTDCLSSATLPAVSSGPALSDDQLLDKIESQSALYAYEQTLGSDGFVKDSVNNSSFTSIAATGFGLVNLVVLAEHYNASDSNWNKVTFDNAKARAQTILNKIYDIQTKQSSDPVKYGKFGLLYHFLNPDGTAYSGSEVSTVDNAILELGVITAGAYFGGDVKTKADSIRAKMDYSTFFQLFTEADGVTQNYYWNMAYYPSTSTYSTYKWDRYTHELFMITLCGLIQSPGNQSYINNFYDVSRTSYRTYNSSSGASYSLYNSYFGSGFTYFFASPWVDFARLGVDRPDLAGLSYSQVNWNQNSKTAIESNRQYCIDLHSQCGGYENLFSDISWGLSSAERPDGSYEGLLGAPPQEGSTYNDACATYTAQCSIPLFKDEDGGVLSNNKGFQVLRYFYDNLYTYLFGTYGTYSTFDINMQFSTNSLGIENLVSSALMDTYQSSLLQDTFMNDATVIPAINSLFGNPPAFDSSIPSTLQVTMGSTVSQAITVTDQDGVDTINLSIESSPSWAAVNPTSAQGTLNSTLTLTPTYSNTGYTDSQLPVTVTLTLKADDTYRPTEKQIAVTINKPTSTNALKNGDFSTGNTSYWTNYGGTIAYNGSNPYVALKSYSNYLYQDVTIPTGTTSVMLQASARYIASGSATSGKPYIYAYVMDSNNKILQYLSTGTSGSSTSWTTISLTSSVSSSGKKLRVFLKSSNINGSVGTNEADFDDAVATFTVPASIKKAAANALVKKTLLKKSSAQTRKTTLKKK